MKFLFTKLFGRTSKLPHCGRQDRLRRLRRLSAFETLEQRDLMVVGAFSVPSPVLPATGYDGVVMVTVPNLCGQGIARGTGALLSTGRHVLTAAHVLTNCKDANDNPRYNPYGATPTVTFEIPGRAPLEMRGSWTIHPGWNGNVSDGRDIAIIELPELAPFGMAARYGFYDGNPTGEYFTVIGYGRTGTGEDGSTDVGDGVRRKGENQFDEWNGTHLEYSFDDDSILGDWEAMQCFGDSGGPALIGTRIAGVSSHIVGDGLNGPNCDFGETGVYESVASHRAWIDGILNRQASLTMNLNNVYVPPSLGGIDVRIQKSGDNTQIFLNGALYHEQASSKIQWLTLHGTSRFESYTVGEDVPVQVQVFGNGGADTATVLAAPGAATVFVQGNQVFDASGVGATFSGILSLSVQGDSADTINVSRVASGATLNVFDAGTVNLGNFGTVQDIRGSVYVWNRPGFTTLNIQNRLDSQARTVTIDTDGSYMALTGLAPARIFWNPVDMAAVNVTTGTGADTVHVRRNSAALNLNSAGGRDTINLGMAGSMMGITSSVMIRNSPSYSTLNLNVSADSADRTIVLTNAAITGLARAAIRFEQRDLAALNIVLGNGNDTIRLAGTPSAATTIIDAGGGTNIFDVGGDAQTLSGLAGNIQLRGAGINTYNFNDQRTNFSRTYEMAPGIFTASGAAPVRFANAHAIGIRGGSGGNTLSVRGVESTPAGGFSIHAGTGNDTVHLGSAANRLARLGAISIDGGGGFAFDTINLDDQGESTPQAYTIGGATANSITARELSLDYSNITAIVLNGGSGGNTIAVRGLRAPQLVINAGNGSDNVSLSTAAQTLDNLGGILVNGGTGTDRLTLDDQNAASAATYNLTTLGEIQRFERITSTGNSVNYSGIENAEVKGSHRGGRYAVRETVPATNLTITAGHGADTFDVSSGELGRIRGALKIDGRAGTNSAVLHDESAAQALGRYMVTDRSVRLQDEAGMALVAVDYTNINNLTVQASQGSDILHLYGTAGGTTTVIHANGGNDQFVFGNTAGTMDAIRGPLTLNGRASDSDYITFYDWFQTSGRTYRFSADTMTRDGMAPVRFSHMYQLISYGGTGDDTYYFDRTTSGPPLTLADAGGVDRLFAPNTSNTWTTAANNGGVLNAGSIYNTVGFNNIEGWIGGSGADSYVINHGQSVHGYLDGRAGFDTLNYSTFTSDLYVNLRTNSATNVAWGIWNIQSVLGGSGNDILVGDGSNTLVGGGGRDLLIAGLKASVLDGGDGEDILVAGTTTYDLNESALRSIRDAWSRSESYTSRVHRLSTGSGVPQLNASTMASNGTINTLHGRVARDLFFASLRDSMNDLQVDEIHVRI